MYIFEALSYFNNLFSLSVLLCLMLGVMIGLIIGAIPGLSPPMAIALLIPVSFNFPPTEALIMMVSCYAAGMYGGSFSAILIRAPGTSASAASAIEGYELTKKGKAIQAIRISTFASVLGGLISGLVLLLLAPPLAEVALLFGPAEYFLMAVLGLTAIASISFGHIFKGLIAGFFGIFLSTIGVDLYSGIPRFSFGSATLSSGIDIMPAIVGLFAFAQGLELSLSKAQETIGGNTKLSWNIWPKLEEIKKVKHSLMRGWGCGLVLGIIPAAGGSIAQWIAYAWEIQKGKIGDKFGKGEIKGLAATEGSNNGCTGTSLIPMFTLGIPGGISAAVILGALVIHGLQPGLGLFKNNPQIVFTVIWGFLAANVLMGLIAAFMARGMAHLTIMPKGLLAPLIIIFSIVGTYVNTNNIIDVWIMMSFGVLGYLMNKYNFSTGAALLGLILGPIAENGLRDLMVVSRGDPLVYILHRPLSLTLIFLTAIIVFYSAKQFKWQTKNKKLYN